MKTLNSYNFKNKTVLLRADLNLDVHKGKVLEGERIRESAVTIRELKKKKAKIVVIAHQAQPGKPDFIDLKQHAKLLNKYVRVKFVNDIIGKNAEKAIKSLKSGEVILLNNIRKEKDEYSPKKGKKNKLYKLVELTEFYVNDAFSVSHRKHSSIVLFPRYLPSCAGRLLEKEVKALQKIKIKKALFILGGAKPEDNIKLLGKNKVLACGLFGQLCLISRGNKLGEQEKYLKKIIKDYKKIIADLRKKQKGVLVPLDFAVEVNGKRKELMVEQFPSKYEIFDIGGETQKEYRKEIKKARVIYMKGPAGYCAIKRFCKGTKVILKAVAKNKGFTLIGGGHLSDAIKISKIPRRKFSHISLSGGALLSYIAGEKLVGLEALK